MGTGVKDLEVARADLAASARGTEVHGEAAPAPGQLDEQDWLIDGVAEDMTDLQLRTDLVELRSEAHGQGSAAIEVVDVDVVARGPGPVRVLQVGVVRAPGEHQLIQVLDATLALHVRLPDQQEHLPAGPGLGEGAGGEQEAEAEKAHGGRAGTSEVKARGPSLRAVRRRHKRARFRE